MHHTLRSAARAGLMVLGTLAGGVGNLAADTTTSPDGNLVVTTAMQASGDFTYALAAHGQNRLTDSRLGLDFGSAGKMPAAGWSIVDSSSRTVDDTWQPVWGKRANVADRFNESTWTLSGPGAPFNKLTITLRVYDDGMAVRYSIPADATGVATSATADLTQFQFAGDYTAWFYNNENHNIGPVLLSNVTVTRKPVMTVRAAADAFLAVHEADLRSGEPMQLVKSGSTGFRALSAPGSIAPGYTGPWRVVFFGTTPGTMIDSHLIELLNPPPTGDFSWVKPGIGLWDWRANGAQVDDFTYTMTLPSWLRMVDGAAEDGLDFLVLDAGWYGPEFDVNSNPVTGGMAADVQSLITYANARGIGIWLYLNDVGGINYPLATTLQTWASWGAAGVKYGFMTGTQTQKLARTRLITELCAANHLVCNFHDGPVHPYGQSRTWPNAVTREYCQAQLDAKRIFYPKTFVTSVFVNMLAGPLDMNNGMFDLRQGPTTRVDNNLEVPSTLVSEAARTLITYSGATILPDIPEYYRKYPDLLRFLSSQKMPWRESKTISGVIGESIVMARQAADGTWLAAAASNEAGRELDIPLDFLGAGVFQATIIQDGATAHYLTNRESLQTEFRTVIASDTIRVKLAPGGGACTLFKALLPSEVPPAVTITSPAADEIGIPGQATELRVTAAVSSNPEIDTPATLWSLASGPGTATFENPASADTRVRFSNPGTYTLRCTASVTVNGQLLQGMAERIVLADAPATLTRTATFREGVDHYMHICSHIRSDWPNYNAGLRDQFLIGNGHRGVMSFPLATIPGGATVLSASLDIWSEGAIADVTKPIGQMELRRLLGNPVEGTGFGASSTDGQGTGVSWTSRTGTINWTTAGGDFDSSTDPGLLATLPGFAPNAAGIQSTFETSTNFVSAVQEAVTGNLPLEMMLTSPDTASGRYVRFRSDDSTTTAERPQLTVSYTTAVDLLPTIEPGIAPASIRGVAAALAGAVTNASSTGWSMVSGPGAVSFSDATSLLTNVVFQEAGDYLLRLTASNPQGEASRTLAISVATNPDVFADWQSLHWPGVSDPDITGDAADPDHDGLLNLMEFALGQSPKISNPSPTSLQIPSSGNIIFHYTRKRGATGVSHAVEWSDTLAADSWSATGVGPETILSHDPATDLEDVSVEVPSGTGGQRFVRLHVRRE